MITDALIRPGSIAVIGASNNLEKPGGKVLANLLVRGDSIPIYPVNPRESVVQSLNAYPAVSDLPPVDLAILVIPAAACVEATRTLAREKGTRAFIVLSAGFSEEGAAGAALEEELAGIVDEVGGSLIGPNCIGVLTPHYNGVFTTPIPNLDPAGCDLISGSGATAVFIMEAGIPKGLTFSRVFSVGNSARIGVEEVLEYLDATTITTKTATATATTALNPKLLYIESIRNPEKLLRHARSLIRKGCPIAAVKAGSSAAGSRAASSHTGALAGSDAAVDALFRKAGIIRCYSRDELTNVAGVLIHRRLKGNRIAVITHAGGPAVMLTDTLSHGGLEVPPIEGPAAEELKTRLFPGSSVANPIDFLATGTAEQLGTIIDYCESRFSGIDGMIVIFGSPGLFPVDAAYQVLHEKVRSCTKPIYPVLPSVVNARREIAAFSDSGNVSFPDEVALGRALVRVQNTAEPYHDGPAGSAAFGDEQIDRGAGAIREVLDSIPGVGHLEDEEHEERHTYLPPATVAALLDAAGIPRVSEHVASTAGDAADAAAALGYPLVMKVIGPVHKSDVGGVVVGVTGADQAAAEFDRLIALPDATGVLLQPMLSGTELFAGVSLEQPYGHLIVAGLGGVFVEVLRDVQHGLVPLGLQEARTMIRSLKGYKLITGTRGRAGAGEEKFADILVRLSRLVQCAPEILEMDLNPLIATPYGITAVDARVRRAADKKKTW